MHDNFPQDQEITEQCSLLKKGQKLKHPYLRKE